MTYPHGAARRGIPAAALGLIVALSAAAWPARQANVVQPNDNRTPAGELRGDTLHLRLVVQMADWYAEADTGPKLTVGVFAEEGKAPQIPAPLIRVREGTVIAATVRNALPDSAVTILGLNTHPSARDSIMLKPGESRALTFAAGAAGTYLYRARIGVPDSTKERNHNGGAFVVDPVGGSPPDRVFVINIWGEPIDSSRYSNALAINGKSWPHTERIGATVGDTLHWRVVNPSGRPHPMHLHGAYFRVDSKGNAFRDSVYAPEERRLAVTEDMASGSTMNIAWSPVRAGRWIFHCHITFHVIPTDARIVPAEHGGHDEGSVDPTTHMAGLVIGIDAKLPPDAKEAARLAPRTLDLFVQEGPKRGRANRALSFILQQGAAPPAPDSTEIPGSLLVLTRDQPTDVRVHNRLKEPTSVHWHGLELESFSDGVAGWGGTDRMPTPPVMPGETFTARLSMPRAGTFIYHTHLRDQEQLTSGLYGPIVVMEPGKTFDPRTDHVHIIGWDSYAQVHLLVNGDSVSAAPIEMRTGESHRFRFINIGAAVKLPFAIKRDSTLAEWRAIAKDGADLPAGQRTVRRAVQAIDVGETYDFEFTPPAAGEYVLSVPTDPTGRLWTRRIIVR